MVQREKQNKVRYLLSCVKQNFIVYYMKKQY